MAHSPKVAAYGEYGYVHLAAVQSTAAPLMPTGAAIVNTTTTTAVSAAGAVVITPASMAGIQVGRALAVYGGTGTAEVVSVTAVTATTFTATFANTHSGTVTLCSLLPGKLGAIVVNNAGTSMVLTLYDGPPALAGISGPIGQTIAVIAIAAAGTTYHFALQTYSQLFYTLTGTPGDLTVHYQPDTQS